MALDEAVGGRGVQGIAELDNAPRSIRRASERSRGGERTYGEMRWKMRRTARSISRPVRSSLIHQRKLFTDHIAARTLFAATSALRLSLSLA